MGKASPDRASIEKWLADASRHVGDDEMKLDILSPEDRTILAVDLEEIVESCVAVSRSVKHLLAAQPPVVTAFEDMLVDFDLSLSHAMWHWKSLRSALSERGIWDDTEDDAST